MATTYRSYEITETEGRFTWLDERGFTHDGNISLGGEGFKTEEQAMDDIDAYRKRMRNAQASA